MHRREFLKLGLVGAAGAATASGIQAIPNRHRGSEPSSPPLDSSSDSSPDTQPDTKPDTTVRQVAAAPTKSRLRTLVVIELDGGNDGLNTLVPIESGVYRDLRPTTFLESKDLHKVADGFGLHPALARLAKRGTAAVAGVGVAKPDGSHFEMLHRWWMGDSGGDGGPQYGFLGRLADRIGDPHAPAVGIGLGDNFNPALSAAKVATIGLGDLSVVDLFVPKTDDAMLTAFQKGIDGLSRSPLASIPLARPVASGMRLAVETAGLLNKQSGEQRDLGGGDLGKALSQAARLLSADVGVRIIQVTMGGFDTHTGHRDQHARLLGMFDEAVNAFLDELDSQGLGATTLVATTSEFGRRTADNGSNGLDHGAASCALLFGPVNAGVHGEQPPLDRLDDGGNLRTTVDLASYYATLASWLGVDPTGVLAGSPRALNGVLRT